jgi:hypothetical protein
MIFLFISYLKEEPKHEPELKIEIFEVHGLNHEDWIWLCEYMKKNYVK